MAHVKDNNGNRHGTFIDSTKIDLHTLAMIQSLLLPTEIKMNDGSHRSDIITQTKELPQGDLIFTVAFHYLCKHDPEKDFKDKPTTKNVRQRPDNNVNKSTRITGHT